MTLVRESVLKHGVGVSGTQNSTSTLCFNSHVIEEVWRLSGCDRSNRKLSVAVRAPLCARMSTNTHTHTHTHRHVIVTREVEKRSSWIGYQICPLSSSVRLQPVTLDHHIFNSDV